ncbi:MAG: ATP-grasp domain-containing protein [Kiritimatiellia bacterium]
MHPPVRPLSGTLGILGGGQLGKMLVAETARWSVRTKVLDPDPECSTSKSCSEFVTGNFRDRQTVLDFARGVDVMTIEIEQVNADALEELENLGLPVYPQSKPLRIIQDKGLQKQFFADAALPSPPFRLFDNAAAVAAAATSGDVPFPFVQKTRTAGYDGRGVMVVNGPADLPRLLDAPCLVEDKVDLALEIAVTARARRTGRSGASSRWRWSSTRAPTWSKPSPAPRASRPNRRRAPPDSPWNASAASAWWACWRWRCSSTAKAASGSTKWPRARTTAATTPWRPRHTSQYGQHLRAILGLPLGDPSPRCPSAMWNLLGEPGCKGLAKVVGLEAALAIPGVHVHVYGKRMTAPFRKMGHVTALGATVQEALDKLAQVREVLKVIA